MMIEEFEALTNVHPTMDLYRVIESEYLDSEDDKYTFCAKYAAKEA